jgi:protocatechuate 3,4-dioxygenase beta subunit
MADDTTLLPRTSSQILGPFYPLGKPAETDDLTHIEGGTGQAEGQVLYLQGRVLDRKGNPVSGAKMEIWQANCHGRYTHPNDDNSAPLDPNFEGFAVIHTDAQGNYSLKTVKPAAYPAGTGMRPSHIHFEVYGRRERLVTQLYFEGDAHHDTDRFLLSAPDPTTIIKPLLDPMEGMDAGSKRVEFDIVLMQG